MTETAAITIIAPRDLDEAKALSSTLSKASLLPAALRGKESDVLLTIMAGAELGLGPIQSIRSIHVIEGKPTLSADLIAALCMRRSDVCEYLQPVETSATKATYTTKRKGAPSPVTMSFTIEEARAAGLAGKGNWSRYPAAMLRARCISAICRATYPDLVGGLYDSDSGEIEAPAAPVRAEVVDVTPAVEAPKPTPKPRRMHIEDMPEPKASPPTATESDEDLERAMDAAGDMSALALIAGRIHSRSEESKKRLRPVYDRNVRRMGKAVKS